MKSIKFIILALTAITVLCLHGSARGAQVTIDHLVYNYEPSSYWADIIDTDGQLPTHLVIPYEITVENEQKTYRVRKIYSHLAGITSPFENNQDIVSLEINADLDDFGSFSNCKHLKSVVINGRVRASSSNPFYGCTSLENISVTSDEYVCAIDNVLYGKYIYAGKLTDMYLMTYPAKRSQSRLIVPADVTKIAYRAFMDKENLTEISVENGNKNFKAENNVLYSADGERIVCCTTQPQAEFTVGAGVNYIDDYSFSNCAIQKFSVDATNYEFIAKDGLLYRAFHDDILAELIAYPLGNPAKSCTVDVDVRYDAFCGKTNLECLFINGYVSLGMSISDDVTVYFKNSFDIDEIVQKHKNWFLAFSRSEYQESHTEISATIDFHNTLSLKNVETGYLSNVNNETYIPADGKINWNGNNMVLSEMIPGQGVRIAYTVRTPQGYEGHFTDYGKTVPLNVTIKDVTQASATLNLSPDYNGFKDVYARIGMYIGSELFEKSANVDKNGNVKIECPAGFPSSITVYFYKKKSNENFKIAEKGIKLKPINPDFEFSNVGPTDIQLSGKWDEGDAKVQDCYFIFNGQRFGDGRMKSGTIDGLDPETEYSVSFVAATKYSTINSATKKVVTAALELQTQAADAVSNNCAIIKSATNIGDGSDGTGFEWRRHDAPQTMPSTVVMCPTYNGYLAGKLNGLSSSTYYDYRPFYKSGSGKIYYGDWITFITADAYVYFDPIVYTYTPRVADDHIELLGYVMAGSDKITEQGFEYWLVTSPAAVNVRKAPVQTEKVFGTGEKMSVRLDDFVSGATYRVRTFVTTESATTYGEEVEFTAPVMSGTGAVVSDNAGRTPVGYYDLYGQRSESPRKGLNIILYSDGTAEKKLME